MRNVIFIAPPGAGKGTFSEMLKDKYGYTHISAGDVLREEKHSGSELGQEIAAVIDKGQLVDHIMLKKLMLKKLKSLDSTKPIIIDGYPRTVEQTKDYNDVVNEVGMDFGIALYINIDKEVLKKRCLGRYSCPKCGKTYNIYSDMFKPKNDGQCDKCNETLIQRADDTEEGFETRYGNYTKETVPTLEYFRANHEVVDVITENGIEEAFEIIEDNIGVN